MYTVKYLSRGIVHDFMFNFHTFLAAHGTVQTLRTLGYAAWSVAL